MLRAILAFTILSLSPTAFAGEAEFRLEPIQGNVFRFTAGHYHSIVMPTPEGCFVADPISPEAARWLKNEIQQRFDTPVRYLVYSHNHFDHTLGGEIFDEPSITCISQELAREDLVRTRTETRIPDLTFKDQLTLHLGDSQVHLRYHGSNNGRGSISMKFMPADVLFVVDWIVLGRLPYMDLKGYDIHGMIDSTREVLDIPFTTFVGGHGRTGDRQDVARYLGYLEALYGRVVEARRAGQTLAEMQKSIRLVEYKELDRYQEWLPLNIEGVSRTLDDRSYLDMQMER
ncbi:glyoxylase-like metal-dependent hydrolase (beta-lactamase superfamily II) [Haloferula luteola]|uniref:Glyoxylase-like metal-dependent hydrolase (Beta-lactamase superfamily II) n=1 Tax=Haloferula luteola TaxID=595692 RepID=A0A840VJH2_9BACT|nr:MBL fold metallo-hydrolase [Haloferula luteola]MBB5352841.1 glyoxylase-like metal-dependent hydrolase (beta-lactamase superfamily II) [Haloferula luteola]